MVTIVSRIILVLGLVMTACFAAPLATSATAQGSSGQKDVRVHTLDENGDPFHDACYVLVDYSLEGCDENRDGSVLFEDVDYGAYIVRQTRDLGAGRYVEDVGIEVDDIVSTGPVDISLNLIAPSVPEHPATGDPIDIALITRDPETGARLHGACYVLVDFSNEGCDENGDGQVDFADIPASGEYTVRQTAAPDGYEVTNDFPIDVQPASGGYSAFVVRQAAEQNAPGTRNVSIVLIDTATGQRVLGTACVRIVNASEIGCDRDLVDGQIDFLDVAEGRHALEFTRLPDGYAEAQGPDFGMVFVDPAGLYPGVIVYVALERTN